MKTLVFERAQSFLVIGQIDPLEIIQRLNIAPGDDQVLSGRDLTIKDMRDLISWLHLKPFSGGSKLAIVQDVDNISLDSANTLLKTLEEPPVYAKIILTATDEQRVLPTIQSRCQKMRLLNQMPHNSVEAYLSPEELAALDLKAKFDWVAQVADLPGESLKQILTLWQMDLREKMLAGKDQLKMLERIAQAKDLIATNVSKKLLMENLVLDL